MPLSRSKKGQLGTGHIPTKAALRHPATSRRCRLTMSSSPVDNFNNKVCDIGVLLAGPGNEHHRDPDAETSGKWGR